MEQGSEVARIKRQIELEYEAAQRGMYGFAAGTTKHEFITTRVENMGRFHEQLITLVGEQEALEQAGNAAPPQKETAQ
jgi:hypothetical protein